MRRKAIALVLLLGLVAAPAALAGKPPKDTRYNQPVWFTWEKAVLDVIIVPPNHGQIVNGYGALGGANPNELNPYANSYLRAIESSVADWDRGVLQFGAAWLQSGLVTNVYVAGRDAIPDQALRNPEIVIFTDEAKGPILGVAVSTRPCLVDNSKFFITSYTYADMYNINGQEYGHCLGLEHVGGGPKGDQVIAHDVMNGTYADNPGSVGTHLHCVSNLNVKGLEQVFAGSLGQGAGGKTVYMDPSQYQKIRC